jgi:hypothetical protein
MPRKQEYLRRFAGAIASLMILSTPSPAATPSDQCRFIGIHRFDNFTAETSDSGERVLLSPVIKAPISWNELVVSWNAANPKGSWLKVEARGLYPDRQTKDYSLGQWSADSPEHPRQSFRGQKGDDGDVRTDTLVLNRPGADVRLRVTLGGPNRDAIPELKFLGLSFLDTRVQPDSPVSDRSAWGKIIPTPERSQNSYPQEEGWCSPTSLSMILDRWSGIISRPELNLDVPEIASNIFDPVFPGTGNWAFNAAFAGSFSGMRAYVARFSDITELETWINAGIPVAISAPWHLLSPGRKDTGSGHLVVCIGFDENGDVVINDPATNLQKGQSVRHIYARNDVINAWKVHHNTVYLIYPENVSPPPDPFGHWDKP